MESKTVTKRPYVENFFVKNIDYWAQNHDL